MACYHSDLTNPCLHLSACPAKALAPCPCLALWPVLGLYNGHHGRAHSLRKAGLTACGGGWGGAHHKEAADCVRSEDGFGRDSPPCFSRGCPLRHFLRQKYEGRVAVFAFVSVYMFLTLIRPQCSATVTVRKTAFTNDLLTCPGDLISSKRMLGGVCSSCLYGMYRLHSSWQGYGANASTGTKAHLFVLISCANCSSLHAFVV